MKHIKYNYLQLDKNISMKTCAKSEHFCLTTNATELGENTLAPSIDETRTFRTKNLRADTYPQTDHTTNL